MLGRQYTPRMGIAEFLAGFGQRRQEVKAAEAQQQIALQAQQGAAIAQGISQAGQGIAHGIETPAILQHRAREAQNIERMRNMGDIYQQMSHDYFRRYGQLPPTSAAGAEAAFGAPLSTQGLDAVTLDATGALGPPSVAPDSTGSIPLPLTQPSAIAEYRQAQEKVREITSAKAALDMNPFMPKEERAAAVAALTPHLAAAQQIVNRHPAPKPPSTEQELIAAGNVIPSTNGGFWYQSEPGHMSYTQGSRFQNVERLLSWRNNPDPVAREQAKQQYIKDTFLGDWEAFQAKGGYGEIDADGSVNYKLPSGMDDFMSQYITAQKLALDVMTSGLGKYSKVDPNKLDALTQHFLQQGMQGAYSTGPTTGVAAPTTVPGTPQAFTYDPLQIIQNHRAGANVRREAVQALNEAFKQYPMGNAPPEVANAMLELRKIASEKQLTVTP